jgi:hypothetical protein
MSFPDTTSSLTSAAMNSLRFALLAFVGTAVSAFAQTAALTADTPTLSTQGGTVSLTAVVSYESAPGALGWSIVLPADWSVISVSGPDVPAITPDAGSGGTLEFAFTSLPPQRTEFTVTVKYPANARATTANSTVLVRSGGKLTTLTPKPLHLSSVATAQDQSRN